MPDYLKTEKEFSSLGFSRRTINVLFSHGIHTRQNLSNLTEGEIAKMGGIGSLGLTKIKFYLRKQAPRRPDDLHRPVSLQFQASILDEIDAWASRRENVKSRSDAIRKLVEIGLAAETKSKTRR